MRYMVSLGDKKVYAAETQEDAEYVVKAMVTGNRWFRSNNLPTIEYQSGASSDIPIQDLELWWKAHIEVGYAGWNAEPLPNSSSWSEGVYHKSKDRNTVIVRAGSALDAIAKAKFMLYTVKGES